MFVQRTPWHVVVVVKDMLTKPKLNQAQLLHVLLGHVVPSTLQSVLSFEIDTGTTAKLADISNYLLSGSCLVCTQAELRKSAFHAQDQVSTGGQVTPFAIVRSDIMGPLRESVCGSKYVLHFTCMCIEWSWEKAVARILDLLEAYEGGQLDCQHRVQGEDHAYRCGIRLCTWSFCTALRTDEGENLAFVPLYQENERAA